MRTVTLNDVKRHIAKCKRQGKRFNWLGFVENTDLSPEVERLFSLSSPLGHPAFDWVHGNEKLRQLELEATQ